MQPYSYQMADSLPSSAATVDVGCGVGGELEGFGSFAGLRSLAVVALPPVPPMMFEIRLNIRNVDGGVVVGGGGCCAVSARRPPVLPPLPPPAFESGPRCTVAVKCDVDAVVLDVVFVLLLDAAAEFDSEGIFALRLLSDGSLEAAAFSSSR